MAEEPEKKPRRRVKKVKGHGGHHGGSWKVAYADLVTALMALFMVLWLVSQADTKLKESIANYFRNPGVFDALNGGIIQGPKKVSKEPEPLTSKDEDQLLYSAAALLEKVFKDRPEFSKFKDQVKIEVTEDGLKIQLLDKADRVSFNSGSADLNEEANQIIAEIARGICTLPNPIQVGGHTDKRLFPPGSTYTNWELSADRANAARRVLEANCVKPEQIQRIVGHADTDLIKPSDPYSPTNRRISIIVRRTASGQEAPAEGGAKKADDKEVKALIEGEASKEKPVEGKSAPTTTPSKPAHSDEDGSKTKFAKPGEGSISVGEADEIPANAKRRAATEH